MLNSQLIQRLRERQVALQAQIAELSTTLLPGHPRIRALKEQVANLDGQIRDETAKVLASLQTAARVAAAREQSLVKSLNEAKVDVSRSNDQGIELRALEREAAAQRDLLELFLARYREAAARTDANYLPADARIISRAVPPIEPSFPKKSDDVGRRGDRVLLIGVGGRAAPRVRVRPRLPGHRLRGARRDRAAAELRLRRGASSVAGCVRAGPGGEGGERGRAMPQPSEADNAEAADEAEEAPEEERLPAVEAA